MRLRAVHFAVASKWLFVLFSFPRLIFGFSARERHTFSSLTRSLGYQCRFKPDDAQHCCAGGSW